MSEAPDMYRYAVEYTENSFHKTDYDTVFREFKDSAVFLRSATWHLSAKCNNGSFAIKSITLQSRKEGVWK